MATDESTIEISVNGQVLSIASGSTIADLLRHLDIDHPAVAVELNLEIQASSEFDQRQLKSGDLLEVVSLVGGG